MMSYSERIEILKLKHRDLDGAIATLELNPEKYYEAIQELKKKKLRLKEEIIEIEKELQNEQFTNSQTLYG